MQREYPLRLMTRTGVTQVMRWLWRVWRIAATGFAFGLLGFLSLLLALFVLPLVGLASRDLRAGEMRAQKCVRLTIRFYLFVLQALGTCRIQVKGGERLKEPGILVVANHPTLLDALVVMAQMPHVDCVVKERYFRDPFLGPTAQRVGYIPSSDGPGMVEACVERLRQGRSIVIFPEGTRSPVKGLGSFARGAAHIALRAGRFPVPVTIRCEPSTLHRDQAWWEVPDRRFELSLSVDDALDIEDLMNSQQSRGRAARELTASLRDYFERRLALV